VKQNLKNILTGAYNSIFIQEEIEKVAKEREKICSDCEWQSENSKLRGYKTFRPDVYCTDCKCNIHMKTRVLSEQCPMKKWLAEVTDEEDDKIQEMLKNETKD
jgi:hypothetical protein